jgi:hypothetical protein
MQKQMIRGLAAILMVGIYGCRGNPPVPDTLPVTRTPNVPPPTVTMTLLPTQSPTLTLSPGPTATFRPSLTPEQTGTHSPLLATAVAIGECIRSFDTFAYQSVWYPVEDTYLPLLPWQVEIVIPMDRFEGEYTYSYGGEVLLVRSIDGHKEVWMTVSLSGDNTQSSLIIIYHTDTQELESIPVSIGDTGLFTSDYVTTPNLFVTNDGAVWAKTFWEPEATEPYIQETVPVLSKFNESTRQFELVDDVMEIPLVMRPDDSKYSMYPDDANQTRFVLDQLGIFWIFIQDDGLYRYDPVTGSTAKQADFPDAYVGLTALAPDGSIYFTKVDDSTTRRDEGFRLPVERWLYQFIPQTSIFIEIETPDEEWPTFSGMLIDHSNRLWLGSTGYRDTDRTWHLINPHAREFFAVVDRGMWSEGWIFPTLMLETSDGRLWFQKYIDSSGHHDGAAWYDPATGEGCLFTNDYVSNIVEDDDHRLWVITQNTLYSISLSP